jgi:hypothetical protein
MGYERHFHRTLVFAPVILGGLGMCQLFVSNICFKIESLICHINSNTTLGKIMVTNLNWLQLISGQQESVLNTRNTLAYISKTWFHPINEYLNIIGGSITIDDTWRSQLLRKADIIIMEEVLKQDPSIEKYRLFNNWRLYFQINNLSEMTTMDGTSIRPEF